MANPSSVLARYLAYATVAVAIAGGLLGVLPATQMYAVHVLGVSIVLLAAASWTLGRKHVAPDASAAEDDGARFRRELRVNASSLVLLVVFLLLALVELLAIPAAMGHLVVFSDFGLGFVSFYPVLIATLVAALAWATHLAAARPDVPQVSTRSRTTAYVSAVLSVVFIGAAVLVQLGLGESLQIKAERSIFVLAASLVTIFVWVKTWLHLPSYAQVSHWLEREERLKESRILRNLVYIFLGVSAIGVVVTIVGATGLAPTGVGLIGTGFAVLALLAATFNVGVSHVVPSLEMGMENAAEMRRKRTLVLSATSIALTSLGAAIFTLTLLAFLAQAAGVELFRSLLAFFVEFYLAIFAIVLVPLIVAVAVRTRFQTEVKYSEKLQAVALGTSTLTIILTFFGVFIGAGFAEGTGVQVDNAVLLMGAAVLALIQFVKARALLPGVIQLIRDAITMSAGADKSTQEKIKSRMVATYVLALVFVMSFIGVAFASTMGVIPSPGDSLGTDVGFFVYTLTGVGILVVVVMRYFQSVNIDQRWSKQREEGHIGKKRLTSEQVKRYLVLGFSIGTASLMGIIGLLIQFGAITTLGPLEVDRKFATDFFVFGILFGIGPYGWYQGREARRIEAIDTKFPEFLRDLAESQRSGMTLTEAVLTASKGQYGELTGDIRKMAAQIEWGVSFSDALLRFSSRVNTPLIGRTVSLVIEASNAGGNVVDVLTAAADDAREIQQIVKERKQSMSIYVMIINIAFAVFIGVIAVLNAQFIPEVAKAVSKADGVSIGGLNFRAFDEDDFKILFFHAAVIQGLGGGLVGGVMSGGKLIHGLRHSFILIVIAWVLFRLVIG